jgi:hypothetical protein
VPNSPDPFDDRPLPDARAIAHCRLCGSGLIYPVHSTEHDGRAVIECRCPECEHVHRVVTSPIIAALWRRRDARIAAAMARLADELAQEAS